MNYCNNCGVEMDDDMNCCPLCGLVVGEEPVIIDEQPQPKQPYLGDKVMGEIRKLTILEKRKIFSKVLGIMLGSGIIVTLIINLIISNDISWAKYNVLASLTIFVNIYLFTIWRERPYLVAIVSLVSLVVGMLLLDIISHNAGWGARLGVPILFALYAFILLFIWYIRASKQLGFNVLAVGLVEAGLLLMCIEGIISRYSQHSITLSWSIVAGASIVPVAALLIYMHYKLKKGTDLKRFFHI